MMSKLKVLSLAALSLPLVANAQPAAQDWELTLGGGGRAQNDFKGSARSGEAGRFNANLGLGYFLNDNLEIGARQSLGYGSRGGWTGSTTAAVDYNIIMDKLVPFVGANLGYTYGNQRRPDFWEFGPEAGIKYYIQQKAFIYGMAEYLMPFRGETIAGGSWRFTVGLGLNL
jgi:hypothetical protein